MERDDIQKMWAADAHRIESGVLINRQLLQALSVNPALAAVRWEAIVELLGNAIAIVLLGSFAADHFVEIRFYLPAVALGICAIVLFGLQVRQIVDSRPPEYGEPITAVQKRLSSLRIRRLRTTQWIFALAVLAWTPLVIVGFKALLGIDVYRFGAPYLWSNVVFGLLIAAIVVWASRTIGPRLSGIPVVRSLVEACGGASLNKARRVLASIAEFENERTAV